ncbi:hypothetical protein ACJ73_06945 [Blastomyces percursus]|uniref:Uncharacterized protein n=1 Tax=Blastomyces percursus TaxID=1658174 RepID=A0A1J9PZG5_9EURO|nr:hypothetical protein ACJ73_06945 [Blastomyces percursus]
MTPSLREHAAAHEIPGRILDNELLQFPALTRIESSNCGTTSVPVRKPAAPRSVDSEPVSSPENPIDLEGSTDQEYDTQPLSEYRDTERDSDSETVDGRNNKARSIQDLEGQSQAQPQFGSLPTGPARAVTEAINASERCLGSTGSDKENAEPSSPRTIPTELTANVSNTSSPHILLHREAGDGCLEFLLRAPVWWSEDAVAKGAPDQLKLYKEKLDTGFASSASQVKKRARSPSSKPRRSLRLKKSRQC